MNEEIKNLSANFNAFREYNQGKHFKGGEILDILHKIGLPRNLSFRAIALNNGLIEKTGKGKKTRWSFPKEPVYYAKIENTIAEYKRRQKQYSIRKQKVSIVEKADSEQIAIDVLKALGYKIYKPVTNYEEV